MPALPLSSEQLADAAKLKTLFQNWQRSQRDAGRPSSQEVAAEQLGFGQSALAQYLNGRIPLNVEAAIKFAKLLDAHISDFSPTLAEHAGKLVSELSQQNDARGENADLISPKEGALGSSIGARLREAREARHMTQDELATRVGMRQGTLSELETGESSGSTKLAALANALGVDAYWLETGHGHMNLRAAEPTPAAPTLTWITAEEAELLTHFRATDDEGRSTILDAAASVRRVLVPGIVYNQR